MSTPLAIELFAGTGSGTAGWVEAGGLAACFDLEYLSHHGDSPAGSMRVIQDVLTIHGSQFKDAAWIWASPPCQKYSYLAMPWSRSKCPLCKGKKEYYAWQLQQRPPANMADWGEPIPCDCKENSRKAKDLRADWEKNGPDNRLFDACFRIQREAMDAFCHCACWRCRGGGHCVHCDCHHNTGKYPRYIPLIVENVRGAIPWVGPSKAQFGSFHLWGNVAQIGNRVIAGRDLADIRAGRGRFGMGVAPEKAVKVPCQIQGKEYAMCRTGAAGQKVLGYSDPRRNGGRGVHLTSPAENEAGTKIGGDWFRDPACHSKHGSRSNARKAASAMIAKIPYALSKYVAEQHFPGYVTTTGASTDKISSRVAFDLAGS